MPKLGESGTATLSDKCINEIVFRPDEDGTASDEVVKLAVSNLEWLLENSIHGLAAADRKHRSDIHHYEKHFSGFISNGKAFGVRISVRVVYEEQGGKKAYELGAFEVNPVESGLDWSKRVTIKTPQRKLLYSRNRRGGHKRTTRGSSAGWIHFNTDESGSTRETIYLWVYAPRKNLLCKNNCQSWVRESRRKKLCEPNEDGKNILKKGMK